MKNIIITSHRRSGTHLTIDTIINNFESFSKTPEIYKVTLDLMASHTHGNKISTSDIDKIIKKNPCVFKTHAHSEIKKFFGRGELGLYVENLIGTSKVIYVHRDGRDVMVSMYNYMKKWNKNIRDTSFSDFIRMDEDIDDSTYDGSMSRVAYWVYHVESWLTRDDCLVLSYDEFKQDVQSVLNKISKYIDVPVNEEINDIRRQDESNLKKIFKRFFNKVVPNRFKKVRHTSVQFNRGKSGSWQDYFTEDDLRYFTEIAGDLNKRLGYV